MKNEGAEAEPTKNQSPERHDQEALENKRGRIPPQSQRDPNAQRKCSCHTLSKPAERRCRREGGSAWPNRQGPIVQSIEWVQAWHERAPPEDSSKSQKDSWLLQHDSHENYQAHEAWLEEERRVLSWAAGRRSLGKTLLQDEVSFERGNTGV
jgi:hypothetical protein